MNQSPLSFRESLTITELKSFLAAWISDAKYQRLSKSYIIARSDIARRLLAYIEQVQAPRFDKSTIRCFLATLADGQNGKQLRAASLKKYFDLLATFCKFLMEEDAVDRSPMHGLKPPRLACDQVQPLTRSQVEALLKTVECQSRYPIRDKAVVLLLLDTGMRGQELSSLLYEDVNLTEGYAIIRHGKGDKLRRVQMHPRTRRAVGAYIRQRGRVDVGEALILAEGREPLQRNGLTIMIRKFGKLAGITDIRCTPHTLRHTFAVEFLRDDGNVFALQQMLGHTTLKMTQRYITIAQADIAEQHRRHSPVGSLYKGEK